MERRIALTLAGTAALVVTAGAAAVAANFGILGVAGAQDDQVGQLDNQNVAALVESAPTTSQPPDVVVIDEYVTVPAAGAVDSAPSAAAGVPDAGAVAPSQVLPSAPAPGSVATTAPRSSAPEDSSYDHDGDSDDDKYEDDEHEDDDHEYGEHEDEEDHDDD